MIKILKQANQLLLQYRPDISDEGKWIDEKLKNEGAVTLSRVFTFEADDMLNHNLNIYSSYTHSFVLGVADKIFYRIDKKILRLKHDLLISKSLEINIKTFVAYRNISVFRKIDALIDEPIIVGGNSENSIPIADFEKLLRNFPNSTELNYYAGARIAQILKDYLGTISDAQKRLEIHLDRKKTIEYVSRVSFLRSYESSKFEYIRDELQEMLKNADAYEEKVWQKRMVDFLLLIFPKYVAVLQNLHVKDFYSNPRRHTNRYIDFTLVDANGSIDIVEIKKPFDNCLLSTGQYRDNYTPRQELSGSVMQVEKYIFHLSKWGRRGEMDIFNKRKSELPPDFEIKITNPKAIIILGRDSNFTDRQKFDFEIMKRKYANIIDILTYDDLLRRLNNIISRIQS